MKDLANRKDLVQYFDHKSIKHKVYWIYNPTPEYRGYLPNIISGIHILSTIVTGPTEIKLEITIELTP